MNKRVIIGTVSLSLLIITGFVIFIYNQNQAPPPIVDNTNDSVVVDTSDWKKYSNKELGINFRYPNELYLFEDKSLIVDDQNKQIYLSNEPADAPLALTSNGIFITISLRECISDCSVAKTINIIESEYRSFQHEKKNLNNNKYDVIKYSDIIAESEGGYNILAQRTAKQNLLSLQLYSPSKTTRDKFINTFDAILKTLSISIEVDTSDWWEYRDPNGLYLIKLPLTFYDLAPYGFYTTTSSHPFGTNPVMYRDDPYFRIGSQDIFMSVRIESPDAPLYNVDNIKKRHHWFEETELMDTQNNSYKYLTYGDINYDGVNGYVLSAFHSISDNKVIEVRMHSFERNKILENKKKFELIISSLKLN